MRLNGSEQSLDLGLSVADQLRCRESGVGGPTADLVPRNRLEMLDHSHESTRQRERTMRRFKSMDQAQRFLAVHGAMKNLLVIPRHQLRAKNYRQLRTEAFDMYQQVTCA